MMKNVDRATVEGERYNLEDEKELHVFDGFAMYYREVSGNPYYTNLDPISVQETVSTYDGEPEPVSQEVIVQSGVVNIPVDEFDDVVQNHTYVYDDHLFHAEEKVSMHLQDKEFLRLSSGHSDVDDCFIPLDEIEEMVSSGSLEQLWPISRSYP
jgi:hypothetical protein